MATKTYLGVDLGAESGRVVSGHWDGSHLKIQEQHRFANGPLHVGGTLRWNVVGLWRGILEGLAKGRSRTESIRSIGVDSWGVDYVLLNQDKELLGQPYCYRDKRTEGIEKELFAKASRGRIFEASGTQFMEINSLYQMFAMARQQPETMKQTAHFMMIGDFFNWLLTGEIRAEYTNATTTQFLNPTTRKWSTDLLGELGIPTDIFPSLVDPGALLGRTGADVRTETGLTDIPVIVPATHDTASAVVATPSHRTGKANWAYISSGTWSLMGVEVPNALLGQDVLDSNMTNEGGVDGTYRLLKNIMGLWLVQECRRDFLRAGRELDYPTLATLAERSIPFRSLIPANDPRFLRPESMTGAIAASCRESGQPVPDDEGQFIRCCLESLAFAYRETMEKIQSITGEKIEVIHIMGGGSQNSLLNQFAANACGVPVIAGPIEATVMGNLFMQLRADGEIGSLSELREASARSSHIDKFEPRDVPAWEENYARWKGLPNE